ncbi:MAG: hypothetical protein LBE55_02565 [Clostridiales bacterium]|nr:hypothetical protein [Clostridiales bacterium]
MKNKIAKAGLCVFAAGLLFTGTVYAAEVAAEYDDIAITSTAFWRKKDKETAPDTQTPDVSPAPGATPTTVPQDAPKTTPPQASPQASPVAVPKDAPKAGPQEAPENAPKKPPKETGETQNENEAALAQYYNNQNQGQQQYRNNQQRQNNQNQGQTGGQYNNNAGMNQRPHSQASDSGVEITRILNSQPNIQPDPGAYIVQHEDGLWLVMGNIRAKLDILIYVDQKNMKDAEFIIHGNAIPLYK